LDLERDKTKDGMMLYSAFYKENLLIFRIGVKVDKIVTHVDFFNPIYEHAGKKHSLGRPFFSFFDLVWLLFLGWVGFELCFSGVRVYESDQKILISDASVPF